MTTDNRTNELNQNETKSDQAFGFTEAQVEAAARALADADNHLWAALSDRMRETFRGYARAALVAAAGAAPQAVGECDNHRPVQHRDGKPPWCNACGLGRPVQPSSTVDEDALAEVTREALRDDRLRVAYGAPVNKPQHVVVARAVAEWLKEQGR